MALPMSHDARTAPAEQSVCPGGGPRRSHGVGFESGNKIGGWNFRTARGVSMYQSPVGGARSGPGSHASHSCARSGASRAAMIAMDAKTKVRRAPWGYPSAPPRAQRSVFCGKRRPPKRSAPELSPSASCARAAADRRPSHNVRGPSVGCMGLPRCVRAGRSALVPRLQKCPDWATAVGAARGASSAARRTTFDRPW